MNSDDALQESNEDRDTDRSPTEANTVASYNVNSWQHTYTRTYMFVNAVKRVWMHMHIEARIFKSLREDDLQVMSR